MPFPSLEASPAIRLLGKGCARHPGAAASFICSRCGAFGCAECAFPGSSLCQACASRIQKRRRTGLALFLALLCPGLGHLYVGRFRSAATIYLVLPLVLFSCIAGGALHPRVLVPLMPLGMGISLAIYLGQVIGAGVLAHRVGGRFLLTRYNSFWIYVLFYVGASVLGDASAQGVRRYVVEPFLIPSGSMMPTLMPGDQVFVAKVGQVGQVDRGRIVVFTNPTQPDLDFIKRVIGLPGDRIRFQNEVVYLNGQALPRALVDPHYGYRHSVEGAPPQPREAMLYDETLGSSRYQTLQKAGTCDDAASIWCTFRGGEELIVPAGSVFVLGDFRDESADSRFGLDRSDASRVLFVPMDAIKGVASVIWLSFSLDEGIRWSRLGKVLEG